MVFSTSNQKGLTFNIFRAFFDKVLAMSSTLKHSCKVIHHLYGLHVIMNVMMMLLQRRVQGHVKHL